MKIQSIYYQVGANKANPVNEVQQQISQQRNKTNLELNQWQESILNLAEKFLDNKNQVDKIHPLSNARFKRIETLEEALKELEELRNEKFIFEGKLAQANLEPQDVLTLFVE